jgi:hypothetical protein
VIDFPEGSRRQNGSLRAGCSHCLFRANHPPDGTATYCHKQILPTVDSGVHFMRIEASRFRIRSFVTLVVFLSFLGVVVSGTALYLRPEGSLARWVGWKLGGLDKKQWEAAHTGVVLLFMMSSLVHIWYNFRTLVSYLRGKATLVFSAGPRWPLILEAAAALAVLMFVTVGTVIPWAPFSGIVHLRSELKDGKYVLVMPPPVTDADKLTIADFCRAAALDTQAALRQARGRGVVIDDAKMEIGKVAQINRISPEDVFLALRGD